MVANIIKRNIKTFGRLKFRQAEFVAGSFGYYWFFEVM
jgi:hypothetical protein